MAISLKERSLIKENAELKRRIALLEEMAFRDPLTGLLNRRGFDDEFNKIISLIHREEDKRDFSPVKSMGIIMLDVDFFKKVNDKLGHSVGDVVLQTIGSVIRKIFRISDILCRWGGEEFVILLPNLSKSKLMCLAEKLRAQVETLEYEIPKLRTTVSMGVAYVDEQTDLDSFIKQADLALYKAKETGRNKIVASWE